jgi:hypothetical protein
MMGRSTVYRIAGPAAAILGVLLAAAPVAASSAWTPPAAVTSSHDASISYARGLAVSGGVAHLVDTRASSVLEYRRSTNAGKTWTSAVALAQPSTRYPVVLGDPAIAALNSLVVFAYRAHDASTAYLIIRVSHDAGLTWAAPRTIAHVVTSRRIGEQSVAISPAGIFVAWTNRVTGSIIVQRSTDQGASFKPAQRIGVTTMTFLPGNPAFTDGLIGLAATGSNVDLAWSPSGDGTADSIVLSRSVNGGVSYLAPATILATPSFGWPALSAAGKYLAGEVEATDGSVIALSSTNAGATVASHRLAGPGRVTSLANGSVAVDSTGTIAFSYVRNDPATGPGLPPGSILVRRSSDGGIHWTPFETVVAHVPSVTPVATAFIGGGTLLVWTSCAGPTSSSCDIFDSRGP